MALTPIVMAIMIADDGDSAGAASADFQNPDLDSGCIAVPVRLAECRL